MKTEHEFGPMEQAMRSGAVSKQGAARGAVKQPTPYVEVVPEPATPTVDPRVIPEAFESGVAQRARTEFRRAHDLLEQMAQGAAAVANDPSLAEDHRKLLTYYRRLNLAGQAGEMIDKLSADVDVSVRSAEKALLDAATPKKRTVDAREIRDYARSLTPEERVTFLHRAADQGDVETIDALLGGAPAYLTGLPKELSAEAKAKIRERCGRRVDPGAAARLDEVREVAAKVTHAWLAVSDLVPVRDAAVEALRARIARREELTKIK